VTDLAQLPRDERDRLAYRILDDRRRAAWAVKDPAGWVDLEFARSRNVPGLVAVQQGGCDPILLDFADAAAIAAILADQVPYPETPRPCDECGQTVHTIESCYMAEWDPTPT
jgi:hypothetical protein